MDISVDEDVTSLSKLAADQRLSQNDYSASWGRGVPSFAPEDTVRDSITEVCATSSSTAAHFSNSTARYLY